MISMLNIEKINTLANPKAAQMVRNGILIFCAVTLISIKSLAAIQVQFYVDPTNGNDNNSGLSVSSAFRSITKARDIVRTINKQMTGDIIINLRGGTYNLSTTLCFIRKDGGSNGFNIIYQAYNEEKPVIDGGKIITGWSLYDSIRNIYSARCGSLRFRQLYANGKRAIRARTPNRDDFFSGGPFFRLKRWGDPFAVWSKDFVTMTNLKQVEVVVKSNWQQSRFRIDTFQVNGSEVLITAQDPDRSNYSWYMETAGNTYFFENSYEFLDAENEWYLDTETATVYYKPAQGTDMSEAEIVVPAVETLLKIEGSDWDDEGHDGKVKNLIFSGITFRYSTWLDPDNNGYSAGQAALVNKTSSVVVPGMVQVMNAKKVIFKNNRFEHSGGQGLSLLPSTDSILIEGNVFTDISANGIAVDPTSNRSRGSSYDIISNNLIELCGRDYTDACGITATFPRYITITHNELRYLPYTAISLGWDWYEDDTRAEGAIISYNKIHNVMQIHDDGGGFYTLGKIRNVLFERNYIYDLVRDNWADGSPVTAVYLDEGSCFKIVRFNVIQNCDQDFNVNDQKTFRDGRPKPTHDNEIGNNFHTYKLNVLGTLNRVSGNILVSDGKWPSEALRIMEEAGLEPQYRQLTGSVIPPPINKNPETPHRGQNTIPHSAMKITATDYQKPLVDRHYGNWNPENAIDSLECTHWHTSWDPVQAKMPQSVTLQFDKIYNVNRLVYTPRNGYNTNGTVLKYNIYLSSDGKRFTRVITEGNWDNDFSIKTSSFKAEKAKFIRLEVLEGAGGYANAAELNIEYYLEK
jgi:hypothetical protein